MDRTASDYLKRHLGKKVEKNEKLMLGNKEFERIGFDWMLTRLEEKFGETQAQGIIKLIAQLGETNQVIYQELDEGIRDPEGARVGCLRKGAIYRVWEETLQIGRCLIILRSAK